MKDEYGGVIIIEFIGLKAKMYALKKIDGGESSTPKGVNIAREFNEFKDILFNKKIIKHKMKIIQAKKHKIGTYEIDKTSLSCFDEKRQVLDDGFHTLAYFHKDSHELIVKRLCQLKKKQLSSIVNEAIRTVYLFIFFIKILKNTKALFKYLNT